MIASTSTPTPPPPTHPSTHARTRKTRRKARTHARTWIRHRAGWPRPGPAPPAQTRLNAHAHSRVVVPPPRWSPHYRWGRQHPSRLTGHPRHRRKRRPLPHRCTRAPRRRPTTRRPIRSRCRRLARSRPGPAGERQRLPSPTRLRRRRRRRRPWSCCVTQTKRIASVTGVGRSGSSPLGPGLASLRAITLTSITPTPTPTRPHPHPFARERRSQPQTRDQSLRAVSERDEMA